MQGCVSPPNKTHPQDASQMGAGRVKIAYSYPSEPVVILINSYSGMFIKSL
ncbi:unnamed protein product, partial [marine sediment metagenome]